VKAVVVSIILWSQVQVLVGPPIVKKPLILQSVAFFIAVL
jgi:hypothetical protein